MPSLAAQYRAHAEEFRLALELGITPIAARAKLAALRIHERERAAADRLAARMNAPLTPGYLRSDSEAEPRNEPWMMRD